MIQPLHDYVLLKKVREEKMTTSGIFLSTSKEESNYTVVVSIGEEVKTTAYTMNDKVICKESEGMSIKEDNEEYILIKDEFIIGVYK